MKIPPAIVLAVSTSILLCGCGAREDGKVEALQSQITALQKQNTELAESVSNLEAGQQSLANRYGTYQDETSRMKLWVLDQVEQSEMNEITQRWILKTNLQDLIFKVGQTAIMSKQ
jgi:predicted nuclease with TOPRIM domain